MLGVGLNNVENLKKKRYDIWGCSTRKEQDNGDFLQHWLAHIARWKVIHNMSQQQGDQ